MSTKVAKRFAMLVALAVAVLCLPVCGLAAEMTYVDEYPIDYAANDGIYFWFDLDGFENLNQEAYQYLSEKFIRDWDGDGTLEADELNQRIDITWTGMTFTAGADSEFGIWEDVDNLRAAVDPADASHDGKQATLTLVNNVSGDRFVAVYTAKYNQLVKEDVAVSASGTVEESAYGDKVVYVENGGTVSITVNHHYEGTGDYTIQYKWLSFDNETGEETVLSATGKTYTFTVNKQEVVRCETTVINAQGHELAWTYDDTHILYPVTTVKFNVTTSHPVVNDVLTVTEGETVTINTNATRTDSNGTIEFWWSLDTVDEEGNLIEEKVLPDAGASYSFVATSDHNGKMIYAVGIVPETGYGDWLYYTLNVVPKSKEEYKTEYTSGIPASAVTPELIRIGLDSADEIRTEVITNVYAKALEKWQDVPAENVAAYEVKLMYSKDGSNWEEVTADNWPAGMTRLTVRLPYPAGTSAANEFVVAHMFATDVNGKTPGTFEYPTVRKYSNYIEFDVTGLSPISVAWSDPVPVASVPKTGDSSTPMLWMLCMLIAATGCVMMVRKRRQNG